MTGSLESSPADQATGTTPAADTSGADVLVPGIGTKTSGYGLDDALDDTRLPFADTNSRSFYVGLIIVTLAGISALATYLILTGLTPIAPRNSVVVTVLLINIALIIAMIVVVAMQVAVLWRAWRRKVAGSRLHVRIVLLFSIIAALPALILAVAATTTFSRSLDGWFSTRTRQIIENSLDVANAYLEEHGQVIRTDIVNMGKDLEGAAATIAGDPEKLKSLVFVQAGLRDLPVAYVIDEQGKPIISVLKDENIPYRPPPRNVIALAAQGEVPLLMPRDAFRVAALKKLDGFPGAYLFVARGVSPKVLGHLRRTRAGVAEYHELSARRGGLKFAHALIYFMISLTSLLAAIWAGLWFSGRFVAPIRRLIAGAQLVSTGNLNVALPEKRGEGDLRRLSETFNKMTTELRSQRDELVTANTQLSDGRAFIEATLAGVTSGVLGLDAETRVTIANRAAEQLLNVPHDRMSGRPITEIVPAFAPIVTGQPTGAAGKSRAPDQVTVEVDGEERTFAVRLMRESQTEDGAAVLTFDDITELVSAQRASAWADVARRIAHEIKNPLTPIQLSAERIRRKYGKVLEGDREVFDKCTETIIRQVGDVSRMVDEFSSFARMPKPQLANEDLRTAVRDSVTLYQMGGGNVRFTMDLPPDPVMMSIDRRLISQAITNLVKNGAEAVEARLEGGHAPEGFEGRVETTLRLEDGWAVINVMDNGAGLSKQMRARLLEPYVTTKAKGTGLGLAIVQKVIEQHGGRLELADAPITETCSSGALVRIRLPLTLRNAATDESGAPDTVTTAQPDHEHAPASAD
jgi:two-component system nitrogen regulation sensor histidine kinase NtrY